ncbi:hypothetical protein RND71_015982 [Anisodus tanguticus]|uniref:Uncharacterized protein n=1 Tax=Anisodus tanguticus TaxID=243964 RepID=A0AAE1S7V2_9SOLA|nr:hypothetical protein RND71_015982 [Anisodus tanguticus]
MFDFVLASEGCAIAFRYISIRSQRWATPWNVVIFEIMMTFSLVYTIYTTTIDPKKGNTEVIAPIAIGFIVGANTLTAGGLYGVVMNPAMAFGQTVDSLKWESHWIYWLGPFVGATIAALVYETIFLDSQNTYEQLPSEVVEKEYLKEYLIKVEKTHVISITP